mmetsp:Transcript_48188/g.135622  ORF Transcript_48188/g.135622 Transcript_48188/m.135622 type:complete len:388 (-) Transcript_48188:989-2152(-)
MVGSANMEKSGMVTTLSCHGLLAQRRMFFIEAWMARPTGTQTSRESFDNALAACEVLISLIGLPSVITTTTEFAPGRPLLSSARASAKAMEVSVVPAGHVALRALSSTFAMSFVKRESHLMPQSFSTSGMTPARDEVQASNVFAVRGPLKSNKAMFTPSLPEPFIDWMNLIAMSLDCFQPYLPKLPLPSSNTMRSTAEPHLSVTLPGWSNSWQGRVLQRRNCSLRLLFQRGQEPRPFALIFTGLMRSLRPVSQALEHGPHSSHSASSHGALQAPTLHVTVSDSSGHGSPPFFGSWSRWRSRVMMPPSHSDEQLVHSDQAETLQATGQGSMLHVRSILSGGHSVPLTDCMTMRRLRICWPPPQLFEHCSSAHSDTWQSVMYISSPCIL